MRSFSRLVLLSGVLLSLPGVALAALTDEDMCRNGLFPSEAQDARIATFAGPAQSRLYFFRDMDGCPSAGTQCQSKSYVVPGDELIVAKRHGDWACAWYPGKQRETVGWVLAQQLRFVDAEQQPAWEGTWKQYDYPGYINIAFKSGHYYVLGNTKWIGAKLADGTRVEHLGSLDGELLVQGNTAHLGGNPSHPDSEFDCVADLVRVGRFLIVHDNANCGGLNVRFDGVYTLRSSHK